MEIPHGSKVAGTLEVESDPVGLYDVATRHWVDVVHQTSVEDDESGPTVGYRMGLRAAFVWWTGFEENVAGHGYFQVQVATDAAFASLVDDVATKANWTTFDGLTSGTTYYFRVRAVDAAGNVGAWSTSVDDPPDLIVDDDVLDVSFNKVTTGSLAVGETASSTGFVAGSSGWIIKGNGDAEFNSVTIRGVIDMRDVNGDGIYIDDSDGRCLYFYEDGGVNLARICYSTVNSRFEISSSDLLAGDMYIAGTNLDLEGGFNLNLQGQSAVNIDSSAGGVAITGTTLTFNGTNVSVDGHSHSHGHSGVTSSEDGSVGFHTHSISL